MNTKVLLIALAAITLAVGGYLTIKKQYKADWNPVIHNNITLETLIAKGTYYSIASKPIFIEKFCKCTQVTYSWENPGHSLNLNESCRMFGYRVDAVSEGIPQDETNARWKNVQWGIISAPYYILEAADDYSYVVVGSSLSYLWLLADKPTFDKAKMDEIFNRQVQLNGYDLSDLEMADQSCHTGQQEQLDSDWNPVVASNVSLETLIADGPYYAIASKPIFIEKFCTCTLVTYSWEVQGQKLNLNESCVVFGHRIASVSEGIPMDSTNARWKNIQSGLISAPYYILEVADDYSYIVVGSTNTYLWLLSRTPHFDEAKKAEIFNRQVQVNGYDISDVEQVDQSCFNTSTY